MGFPTTLTPPSLRHLPHLTGGDVIAEMRRLAEKFPDKSAACVYVGEDEAPCCIGGRALANLGVSLASLQAVEGYPLPTTLDFLGIESDYYQKKWMAQTQSNQDHGDVWGVAVGNADATVPGTSCSR